MAPAFCRTTLPPETPIQSIPESFPGVKTARARSWLLRNYKPTT